MKAIVTKITKMEKIDSYGNTSFIIEFDNGDKGFYSTKNAEQNYFVVGKDAEYNIEAKQGSKGTYYKVTTTQKEFSGGFKKQIDPKVQMISFAMAYSKDLVVSGKVDLKDLGQTFERMYQSMISKL